MKTSKGFILLETVISMSIISIAALVLFSSIGNSTNAVFNTKKSSELLNICKEQLIIEKNIIKEKENVEDYTNTIISNGYEILTTRTKQNQYYNCFKIEVSVSSNKEEVELISYVTKE